MGSLLTICGGKEDASKSEDPQKTKHDCQIACYCQSFGVTKSLLCDEDTTFNLILHSWDKGWKHLEEGTHGIKFKNLTCLALTILKNNYENVVASMGDNCDVNYDRITAKHFLTKDREIYMTIMNSDLTMIESDNEIGWTPLMLACRWSPLECGELVVDTMVRHPEIQLDKRNGKGETALSWAVRRPGNRGIVKDLIEAGGNICLRDSKGYSCFYRAVEAGDMKIVKELHEKGANLNVHSAEQYTPLWKAASQGNLEMVQFLVENGARLDSPVSYGTCGVNSPLHEAVKQGHLEIVKFMIEKGAHVMTKSINAIIVYDDKYWYGMESTLQIAEKEMNNNGYEDKKKSYEEILGMLKAFEAAPKYDEAVKTEIVKLVIEQGDHEMAKSMDNIVWNDEECRGISFTLEIVEKKINNNEERKQIYEDIISFLKVAGADSKYDEAAKTCDCTILEEFAACVQSYRNRNEVINLLLKNVPCLVSAVLGQGMIRGGSVETSLSKGCDVNFNKTEMYIEKITNFTRDPDYQPGWTPLMLACKHSCLSIVSLLIQQPGIEIDKMNTKEEVALSWAVRRDDNLDMVKLLVEAGADPDIRDSYGFSHLHHAATNGQWEIVKYLQSKGADVNTQDNGLHSEQWISLRTEGCKEQLIGRFTTPLWMAAEKGDLDMVKYLVNQGAFLETPVTKDNLWDCLSCDHLYPLNIAVRNVHVEVVRFLIEQGADVNLYGGKSNLEIAQWSILKDARNEEIISILKEEVAQDNVPRYMLMPDGSKPNLEDLLSEIGRALP